jgi:aspartate/methionine/tyrosine aminotransferase
MSRYPSSPREATATLRRLAASLGDPSARTEALGELETLVVLAEGRGEDEPLRLREIEIAVGTRQERLRLLLLPSIPPPEDRAFGFLEGLMRLPPRAYEGKRLLEVGAGSGWVCIALARITGLASIVGLDPSPHAEALATCNLWLNGDESIAARVSFSQGDLLRHRPPEERWDFIVGSFPRAIENPSTELPEEIDDGALHDSACALQRIHEDRFGLGPVLRLLEEAPERLLPGGRLLLELEGRPGRSILERMFARRGHSARVVASRRVEHPRDADLRNLADLEEATRSEFEFYLTPKSAEPVCARTALGWLEAGHPIWHEVAVWEARPRHPRELLALRRGLNDAGVGRLLDSLDLGEASRERLGFAASLAKRLADRPCIPRTLVAGDLGFREKLCRYFERRFDLGLSAQEIFVAPERAEALHSLLLSTCDPGDEVLATRTIFRSCERAFEKAGVRVTVANDTLREVRGLLGAFQPKVVFVGVPEERTDLPALLEIADDAAERGIWVVVDGSAHFDLAREVGPGTVFELLAGEPHRPNLVVLCRLGSAVHPDLELTLLLPVPERLFSDLEIAADVTYSRISTPVQWLFEDLVSERLASRVSFGASKGVERREFPSRPLPRSRRIEELAASEAFAPAFFRADDPRLLRLDQGENEDRIPFVLLEGLVAAALRPESPEDEGLREAISAFFTETRGVRVEPAEVVVAQGVRPLLHDVAFALGRTLGRAPEVFAAAPCPGGLPPTLRAAGCLVETGPLSALWEREAPAPDAIVVSQPANPDGRFLDESTLRALADYALERGCRLFSDESYGLLALHRPKASRVPSPLAVEPRLAERAVVFGGLSGEFAAGGLRMGWAVVRDAAFRRALTCAALGRLPRITAAAAAHLYGAWLRGVRGRLVHPKRRAALDAYLESLRRALATKRDRLAAIFDDGVGPGEVGGLFLAPDVSALLGKTIGGERLTPENLPRVLYRHTGVVVNGGPWSSDPSRIRLVFSLPREKVEEAARRLRDLLARLEP